MHILLTRPLEDCSQMILKFQSLGNKVSHLPLLKVDKIDYDEINFSEFKGVVFTSANAVKFLDHKIINKKILCFCVGSATEKKALSIGFQNVIAAEGNVENLKELIFRNFDKKGMSIFEILIGIKCIEINKTNIIKTSLFDGLILVLKSSKKPIKNIKLHMNKYSNKIFE